jgi:PAS domain-containing protein
MVARTAHTACLTLLIKNLTGPFFFLPYPKVATLLEGRMIRPLRVLLVEENLHDTRFFSECCKDFRTPVYLRHERTSALGLEQLLKERYDILVLSAFLEGGYDFRFLRRVRLALPSLPVVLLLDGDDSLLLLASLELGTEACLSKSDLDETKLERTLFAALNQTRIKNSLPTALPHTLSNAWLLSGSGEALSMTGTEHLYGVSTQQFVAEPNLWERFVHPEDKHLLDGYWDLLNEKGEHSLRYRIVTPNGRMRELEDKARVVQDGNGKVLRFEGVVREISPLRSV